MLRLLVDTSTWLDLAKRRDGQKWIVTIRLLIADGDLELLVPAIVVDEFERNRLRIEASMTASVAERMRLIRRDFAEYGSSESQAAIDTIDSLAHQVPLIGAMATRNFDEILILINGGRRLEPSDVERRAVVQRGLDKRAPFHRARNSVADALLIELYGTEVDGADLAADKLGFVTSNSDDFSLVGGDQRQPHEDLADYFTASGSRYWLGVDGLDAALADEFGEYYQELLAESDFQEDPRRLDEIIDAESEFFDRIWYNHSLGLEHRAIRAGGSAEIDEIRRIAEAGRKRVEERFGGPGNLGPYTDFEWGMLNGKLSALRWVLGSEWDFLDT